MGDRLWTGKPPRHRTRQLGLLSLNQPSVVRLDRPARILGITVFADAWLEDLLVEISADVREVVAHYTFSLLYSRYDNMIQ